jgi:uncharacterized protein DUF5662
MKHLKYLRYLVRHKWFVFVAGLRLKVPLWRLIIHDWSKFLPCEWIPYANFFYGPKPDAKEPDDWKYWAPIDDLRARFDRAWLHHQHFNPHHWQHWVLRNDDGSTVYLHIPENFVREMVADWCGAGRAITGKWEVRKWYTKNQERILLHPRARDIVEALVCREQDEHQESLADA